MYERRLSAFSDTPGRSGGWPDGKAGSSPRRASTSRSRPKNLRAGRRPSDLPCCLVDGIGRAAHTGAFDQRDSDVLIEATRALESRWKVRVRGVR